MRELKTFDHTKKVGEVYKGEVSNEFLLRRPGPALGEVLQQPRL